jgi:HD superfamily phosphodiesterase
LALSSIVAPDVVETPLEQRFLDRLREVTEEVDGVMERHGLRCFLLLERLATRRGLEIDREVALCAALAHDIGIYPSASHGGVYTDESGELAAALFAEAPFTTPCASNGPAEPRSSCCGAPT